MISLVTTAKALRKTTEHVRALRLEKGLKQEVLEL